MFAFSSVVVAICLCGLPPDPPPATSSALVVRPAVSRKATDLKGTSALSIVRKAELQKTISKRKEYRERSRGRAYRQTSSMAPVWSAAMGQMMTATIMEM